MNGRSRKFGHRLTVSLTGDDYNALTVLADKDEVSVSWVIRRAIDGYLRKRRPESKRALPVSALQKAERPAPRRTQQR